MTTSNGRILMGLALTWLVPGLGHYLYGRRSKAVFYFVLITFAFVMGMWLGEWRDVNVQKFSLYLIAQMWNGGSTLVALLLTRDLLITHDIAHLDVGLLYTAVAGLLNVVILVDLYEIHLKVKAGLEESGS
ncbi:MAG: DUF6677 family protein [Planctomycetota bacterium]